MNYIFRNAVLDYASGVKATDMYSSLEYIREAYPPQSLHALMNILSSHDVARSLHVFGYEPGSDAAAIALAKQRLRLAWFFQMSYPGAPAVYYGDEVGVTGGNDPFNRASYPWADRGGAPDEALLADFKRLVAMRKAHEVLRRGSLSAPLHIDDHVLVLARQQGEALAITATNNGKEPASITVNLPAGVSATQFVDALTGATIAAKSGRLTLEVPAMFGTVLIAR
jgi:cyclomaltodextrinase